MLGELRESFSEETLLELRPEQLVGLRSAFGERENQRQNLEVWEGLECDLQEGSRL